MSCGTRIRAILTIRSIICVQWNEITFQRFSLCLSVMSWNYDNISGYWYLTWSALIFTATVDWASNQYIRLSRTKWLLDEISSLFTFHEKFESIDVVCTKLWNIYASQYVYEGHTSWSVKQDRILASSWYFLSSVQVSMLSVRSEKSICAKWYFLSSLKSSLDHKVPLVSTKFQDGDKAWFWHQSLRHVLGPWKPPPCQSLL